MLLKKLTRIPCPFFRGMYTSCPPNRCTVLRCVAACCTVLRAKIFTRAVQHPLTSSSFRTMNQTAANPELQAPLPPGTSVTYVTGSEILVLFGLIWCCLVLFGPKNI